MACHQGDCQLNLVKRYKAQKLIQEGQSLALFPFAEEICLDQHKLSAAQVISMLDSFVSSKRKNKLQEVVAQRSFAVVPVLDSIHDTGNLNSVFRCAENFGFAGAHVVQAEIMKRCRKVTQGCDKWMEIYRWPDRRSCIKALKNMGYKIVVTHLREESIPLQQVNFNELTAVVFGNERTGVNKEFVEAADICVRIPTAGLSESLNISVAAGICMSAAYADRVHKEGKSGDLTSRQQEIMLAHYYLRSTRHSSSILKQLLNGTKMVASGQ